MTRQLGFYSDVNLLNIDGADILNIFNLSSAKREFDDLEIISSGYGYNTTAVILPDIPVAAISDEMPVWIIAKSGGAYNRVKQITISNLKSAIQRHSGGPVRVGSKGLTYGTSAVECYLSKTDAAFPGDADAVIVDMQNRVRCVIEYKKHTLQEPIGEHLMTKYYPRPDGRKYQRLVALAKRYKYFPDQSVPLVVFYYSTRQPVIRLQEIGSLDEHSATIIRDSGDISTCGRFEKAISDDVVRWLGVC